MRGWRIGQRVKVKNKVHGYGKVGTVVKVFSSDTCFIWVRLDTESQDALYNTRDLRKVRKFD